MGTGRSDGVVVALEGRRTTRVQASARLAWIDRRVLDARGVALGVTVAVFSDPLAQQPAWLAVYTGVPDAPVVVVPVCGSSLLGDDIVIDGDRSSVLAAPAIEVMARLDPAQHRLLADHFRRHALAKATPTE